MRLIHTTLTLAIIACLVLNARADYRTWTNLDGRTLEGEILSLDGDQVSLKTDRGVFEIPLSRLSLTDRKWAQEWDKQVKMKKEKAPKTPDLSRRDPDLKPLGNFDQLKLGDWPAAVAVEIEEDSIKVITEDEELGVYVYQTEHFEFESPFPLSRTVVKDFARAFEATYELARQMPIGLGPKPWKDGHYQAKIFATFDDYLAAGGSQKSSGQHSYSYQGREITESIVEVPLSSLGVEFTGNRVVTNSKDTGSSLTYEIMLQMMGSWLVVTPTWFHHGLCQTVRAQTYDDGRFSLTNMARAVRENATSYGNDDREFVMQQLERLMTMDAALWENENTAGRGDINYPSAALLFYYFLRLEGNGDGANLVKYMQALSAGYSEEEARSEILMQGKSYAQLQDAVATAWRKEGLRLSFY